MTLLPTARQTALGAQAVTAAYANAIEWFDLFPWNDPRRTPTQTTTAAVQAALQAGVLAAYARGSRPLMWVGTGLYGTWLASQVSIWWVPYFVGAPAKLQKMYDRRHRLTTKILRPYKGRQYMPDAAHILLHLLIAGTTVASAVAARRAR